VPWLSFPAEDLSKVDVIVIADVPEITEQQAEDLENFVREGNGLVWFAGNDVKAGAWNDRAASAETPLLPARLKTVVNSRDAQGAGKPLDADMPDHSVCLPLLSLPEDLLSETRFNEVMEVAPSPNSFTVLRLAGSGPALFGKSFWISGIPRNRPAGIGRPDLAVVAIDIMAVPGFSAFINPGREVADMNRKFFLQCNFAVLTCCNGAADLSF